MARAGDKGNNGLNAALHDPVVLSRLFFILIATMIGAYIGDARGAAFAYSIGAAAIAILFVILELATNFVSSKNIVFVAAGAMTGLVFSNLFILGIQEQFAELFNIPEASIPLMSHLVFGYIGIALAVRHADRFSFKRLSFILSQPNETEKIIDTSILVDGRLLDVLDTNILSGPYVVPHFVVEELQHLADSTNAIRRNRGRRALEVLEMLRDRYGRLRLDDTDYPKLKVDQKLLRLTAELEGVLMTNDYNLQKVAQIHRVRTINLNELANVLKPRVYNGEELTIHLDRPGKDEHQAVGYLDDGTMVIVEHARNDIGNDLIVEVKQVLQTSSGRMVFARKLREAEYPIPSTDPDLEEVRRTRITPKDLAAVDPDDYRHRAINSGEIPSFEEQASETDPPFKNAEDGAGAKGNNNNNRPGVRKSRTAKTRRTNKK